VVWAIFAAEGERSSQPQNKYATAGGFASSPTAPLKDLQPCSTRCLYRVITPAVSPGQCRRLELPSCPCQMNCNRCSRPPSRPVPTGVEAPRTVPLPLAPAGITVAALARGHAGTRGERPVRSPRDVITTYAPSPSGLGQITVGAAVKQAVKSSRTSPSGRTCIQNSEVRPRWSSLGVRKPLDRANRSAPWCRK
jgi:hypothetical protein